MLGVIILVADRVEQLLQTVDISTGNTSRIRIKTMRFLLNAHILYALNKRLISKGWPQI